MILPFFASDWLLIVWPRAITAASNAIDPRSLSSSVRDSLNWQSLNTSQLFNCNCASSWGISSGLEQASSIGSATSDKDSLSSTESSERSGVDDSNVSRSSSEMYSTGARAGNSNVNPPKHPDGSSVSLCASGPTSRSGLVKIQQPVAFAVVPSSMIGRSVVRQ